MNRQTQKLELTLEQDVINGFSYSFTKSLLEKLKKLKKEDRVFEYGWKKATEERNPSDVTAIASVVISYLCDQIQTDLSVPRLKPIDIDNLIATSEEFLSIFSSEKK